MSWENIKIMESRIRNKTRDELFIDNEGTYVLDSLKSLIRNLHMVISFFGKIS